MKWYFAATGPTLAHHDHDFPGLMAAAVASARANTELEPNLLYDGEENEVTGQLRALGVRVHRHVFSQAAYLETHAPPGYSCPVARGAFLRTDIPEIERDEEFVLYTDCDVLFLRRPSFLDLRPAFFACAPEADPNDYRHFNTGVMLMNLPALRRELDAFRAFIRAYFPLLVAFDQGAYQRFYAGRGSPLPQTANWKPYWGFNGAAEVLHFHGPKPVAVRKGLADSDYKLPKVWRDLLNQGAPAYARYLQVWLDYRAQADALTRAAAPAR